MTSSVAEELRNLPRQQARSVAQAIEAIGSSPARPLLPGADGKHYMIIAPTDSQAPAVIYRELDEGSGYLVTALVERGAYDAYESADKQSVLGSPILKAILAALGGAAIGALISSLSGKSSADI